MASDKSTIDPTLFEVDRSSGPSHEFITLNSSDVTKKGAYSFGYKVYHTNYPDNSFEVSPAFTITITNECTDPVSIIPQPIDDQEYTLTDTSYDIIATKFVATPDYCDVVYSIEVSDPIVLTAMSFLPETRVFTFFKDSDLEGASDSQVEYTVTLKAVMGSGAVPIEASTSFTLTLKNPCIDSAHTSIKTVPLPVGLSYQLWDYGPGLGNGYRF